MRDPLLVQTGTMEQAGAAVTLTQTHFDEYARLSGDDNPIHVDPGFAAGSRFGRTVAHGMFLFGILHVALARELGGPVQLATQELIFRAPTYTDDPLVLSITRDSANQYAETITRGDGTITVSGVARVGSPDPEDPVPPMLRTSGQYRRYEVGMSAGRTRTFTAADVESFLRLVDDPRPRSSGPSHEVPPALLAGMESALLGVELPGRGTNWLKQRFTYHRAAVAPAEVTTTVMITRIRPDKGLINLATRTEDVTGLLVTGETLVLAADSGSG